MSADKIKKSASELVEFFNSESPYRQANKGWIAENIFLNLKPDQEDPSKRLDQIAEVSLYWQPIFQIAIALIFVISLSALLAFSPIYLFH